MSETTNRRRARHYVMSNIQLVNWGNYNGYAFIDPLGKDCAVMGKNGHGKSTMIDMVTALFHGSRKTMNQASNNSRSRAFDEKRSIYSYVRGAYGANETGATDYLRPATTGSAGAITVHDIDETGDVHALTWLVTYSVTAASSTTVNRHDYVVERDLDLSVLADPTVATTMHASSVKAVLSISDEESMPNRTAASNRFCAATGLTDRVLELLYRIQNGEAVSSITDLFRSTVIERPSTFEAAETMEASWAEALANYQASSVQNHQYETLKGIDEHHKSLLDAQDATLVWSSLRSGSDNSPSPLETWTATRAVQTADNDTTHLSSVVTARKTSLDQATDNENSASEAYNNACVALTNANQALADARSRNKLVSSQITAVERERERVEHDIAPLQRQLNSLDDLEQLLADEPDLRLSARKALDTFVERKNQATHDAFAARDRIRALDNEKARLGSTGRPIPDKLLLARAQLARIADIDEIDLPFAAELMSVKPEHASWSKAISIANAALAKTILVAPEDTWRVRDAMRSMPSGLPRTAWREARTDIDSEVTDARDMAARIDFGDSRFAGWLRRSVVERGVVCIEDDEPLPNGRVALHLNGAMSSAGRGTFGHAQGDDHLLDADPTHRLVEIESETAELNRRLEQARQSQDRYETAEWGTRARLAALDALRTIDWSQIDAAPLREELNSLNVRIQTLETDPSTAQAQAEVDKTKEALRKAQAAHGRADGSLINAKKDVDAMIKRAERYRRVLAAGSPISDEDARILDSLLVADVNENQPEPVPGKSLSHFEEQARTVSQGLTERYREASERTDREASWLVRTFKVFNDAWPEAGRPATLESVERFKEIYAELTSNEAYVALDEQRNLLIDEGAGRLGDLYKAMNDAQEDIAERVDEINEVLAPIPFGPEHLRMSIRVTPDKGAINAVKPLMRTIKTAHKIAQERRDVPTRTSRNHGRKPFEEYVEDVLKVISSSSTDQAARERVLDVRRHSQFSMVLRNSEGKVVRTIAHTGVSSGGQIQEATAFISAASLRYALTSSPEQAPSYAPVILDEGFSRSDTEYTNRAMDAYSKLGFQTILVSTPEKVQQVAHRTPKIFVVYMDEDTKVSGVTPINVTKMAKP